MTGQAPLLDQVAGHIGSTLKKRSLAQRTAYVPAPAFTFPEFNDELAPTFCAINAE